MQRLLSGPPGSREKSKVLFSFCARFLNLYLSAHLFFFGRKCAVNAAVAASYLYEAVTAVLTAHFRPKKNKLAERYRFRKRAQRENETLDTFIAELRNLSLSCD